MIYPQATLVDVGSRDAQRSSLGGRRRPYRDRYVYSNTWSNLLAGASSLCCVRQQSASERRAPMSINRLNAAWQNFPGAPGVTTFYTNGTMTQAEVDAFRAFFLAIASLLPTGLTVQVPSSGDIIDEATGDITSTWSVGTTPAVVTGTKAGVYAGNAGAVVHWLTNGVVAGRRVRGRSFLVPIGSGAYDNQGSLAAGTITTLQGAANALVAGAIGFSVWARPLKAGTPPVIVRPGSYHGVAGMRVPDLAVSLRSRRT